MSVGLSRPSITIDPILFAQLVIVIDSSGVVEYVADLNGERGRGGRPPSPVTYTFRAVLVALLFLVDQTSTPSIAAAFRVLVSVFTGEQREQLGMVLSAADQERICANWKSHSREYTRFIQWLTRHVRHLDAYLGLPARKVTNAQWKSLRDARSEDDNERSRAASQHAHTVVNLIVAASVVDKTPVGYECDVVTDETTYDTGKVGRGDGTGEGARRGGSPGSELYARNSEQVQDDLSPGIRRSAKVAFGFGLTAIRMVPPPNALGEMKPMITALAFGKTTSGSVDAVRIALKHHRANGFDVRAARTGKNRRRPFITVDMGYSMKNAFPYLAHEYEYDMIARYPKDMGVVLEAEPPAGSRPASDRSPGPIMASGAFYCPYAAKIISDKPRWIKPSHELTKKDGGAEHDRFLGSLLPLLMGVNSRVKFAAPAAGRPSKNRTAELVPKVDLVCPAIQGRVRCHLKPNSMLTAAAEAPTIHPDWPAESRTCCSQTHLTVTLSEKQFKQYQPAYPPGSWEHTFLFEAYRSMTERMFSFTKSPHLSNIQAWNWGSRRDPMLMITIALIVASANISMALNDKPRPRNSYHANLDELARTLHKKPVRVPPRT